MITIRSVTNADVNSLSELAGLCFIDTFGHLYSQENLSKHLEETCSPEFFKKALKSDSILIAKSDDGRLVGYMKLGEVGLPIEALPENSKEIHRLYIHPDFKGQGIGSELMQKAFEMEILKNAKNIYLSVYEDNLPAQKFYKKYGFSTIGEYDYYVGSHIDREYIMHKNNH